jgi:cytidine diphosphoramidate kinase
MQGTVWWITGLSGAGKSTISQIVRDGLVRRGRSTLLLDGDMLRAVLGESGAHGPDDRCRLAMTYARLAREVAAQGIDAVCGTISMFQSVRDWNRAHIPHYREIYLRVPISELERRDTRGIYARSRRGEEANVVGIDMRFEEPVAPDLVIDNVGIAPAEAAARILSMAGR